MKKGEFSVISIATANYKSAARVSEEGLIDINGSSSIGNPDSHPGLTRRLTTINKLQQEETHSRFMKCEWGAVLEESGKSSVSLRDLSRN
ncbi:unnamed protein product [Heterotrigona itama]|uniref:Uncharacterized protein n=1 Tax=Heterotrigona itama TaxID=395501 RepID=A0A6V7H139_9HYME|nr:unnamed protein product [Heterotrigona itama]